MPHLRSIALRAVPPGVGRVAFRSAFRSSAQLRACSSSSPTVTFLVGENGRANRRCSRASPRRPSFPTVGSESLDATTRSRRSASSRQALKLTWNRRVTRGFFLRAEDFFGFTKSLVKLRAEMLERLREIDEEFVTDRHWAKGLAKGPRAAFARRDGAAVRRRTSTRTRTARVFSSFSVAVRARRAVSARRARSAAVAAEPARAHGDDRRHGEAGRAVHHRHALADSARLSRRDDLHLRPACRSSACEYEELDHVVITRDFLNARERFLKYL